MSLRQAFLDYEWLGLAQEPPRSGLSKFPTNASFWIYEEKSLPIAAGQWYFFDTTQLGNKLDPSLEQK